MSGALMNKASILLEGGTLARPSMREAGRERNEISFRREEGRRRRRKGREGGMEGRTRNADQHGGTDVSLLHGVLARLDAHLWGEGGRKGGREGGEEERIRRDLEMTSRIRMAT